MILQSGQQSTVDVVTINNQVVQMVDTQGFQVDVVANGKDGNPISMDSRGMFVFERGRTVTVRGKGFQKGSTAVVWLFSSPRRLGVMSVSSSGAIEARLNIADDIQLGEHTAQVNGLNVNGEVRSLNIAVFVADSSQMVGDEMSGSDTSDLGSTRFGWRFVAVLLGGVGLGLAIGAARRRFARKQRRTTS